MLSHSSLDKQLQQTLPHGMVEILLQDILDYYGDIVEGFDHDICITLHSINLSGSWWISY